MATPSSLSPGVGETGDSNAQPATRSTGRSGSVASNQSNTSAGDGPQRSPSISSINRSGHRQSFADNLRHIPPSPRQRQPSLTQAAIQELLNNPPHANRFHNPQFANREWTDITVGELVSGALWVEMDSTVEDATMQLLSKSQPSVVLVRENKASKTAVSTFDFRDLNAYLVVVVGLAKPAEDQIEASNAIVAKTQRGEPITVREIQPICRTEPLVSLPTSSNLAQAMEVLGSGIHRLLVSDPTSGEVVGILSQGHMVEFFWNEGVNFASIDQLYPLLLRDLNIGTKETISVNSDAPLSEALMIMFDEGLTSVAVVDNGHNVVGNISTKDVRHLTSSSSAPLLKQSCMHFISIILNERGVENGRDTFPVFYVSSYSTLAHTVAKLVATRSHRMWVVESSSPSPTAPETPLTGPSSFTQGQPAAPPSPQMAASVPASAMMGARMSGKLSGVVSLTDVLNTFAKSTGLHPSDPRVQRARRRKSSSSSMRPSIDSIGAGHVEGQR